jgi:RNA polymerase sigma-70 factor (ECF subfamily)
MSLREPADSSTMISDALLVEGLRQGDETSFEVLFHRHYPRVYGLLVRLLGDTAEGDNVGGWLYRVATNLGYNALRSTRRRDQREQAVMAEMPLTAPSAAAEAERRALQVAVRAALARMKPRDGQLLLLRQMGFSYRELAEALDVSPNSIGTLLARAEKAFLKAYGRAIE